MPPFSASACAFAASASGIVRSIEILNSLPWGEVWHLAEAPPRKRKVEAYGSHPDAVSMRSLAEDIANGKFPPA
jgi:D-mannonate dehydratase